MSLTSFHVLLRPYEQFEHFEYIFQFLKVNLLNIFCLNYISTFFSHSFFQAFRPSPSSPLSHSTSSSQFPYFWVPSKIEAQEAVPVPFQPTVDTQLSNEIEFHKSNELLVPGKQKV